MVGARSVISALWPVSDEATAEMMSQLYERRQESIPDTMRRIQIEKIKELRQSGQPDHPFTWAGFIAMGDWR
jgi:CHAT domain-containing protein